MALVQPRAVYVFAHLAGEFVPAGKLELVEQGSELLASNFAYGQRYLDRANALEIDPVSLGLRQRDAVRGKRLVPANGLKFFGGIRDAAPDAWGRRVIEARHQAPANSLPESTYLLEAGSERVGALDVRMQLADPARHSKGSIASLGYLLEAADRIENGLPIPDALADIFDSGSALGGTRPKVSVRDDRQVLWLAKFPSRHDALLDVPTIEHATLRLAAAAGLDTPELRLIQIQGRNVLLIRRFDRSWSVGEAPVELRHGMISALTLLACDELDSPHKSYMDIAGALHRHGAVAAIRRDSEELYARMVFNIFVGNDDDHPRNHACVWRDDWQGWALSPLFDVMPRPMLATERYQHLGVGPQGRLATLDNAYAAKERFGLSAEAAASIIDRIWRAVRQWRPHFEHCGVPPTQIETIAPAFRHFDDIATSELRKRLATKIVGADEATALQGGRAKNALMKPLRSKAVEQTMLSSPLRILAVADGGTA